MYKWRALVKTVMNISVPIKCRIKMDLREVGWWGADWIDLAQDRDRWRGSCVYGDEPSGSIKFGEFLE
jgi:hypothetical protein